VDRNVFFSYLRCIRWWRVEAKYNSLPRLEILNSSNVLVYSVSCQSQQPRDKISYTRNGNEISAKLNLP